MARPRTKIADDEEEASASSGIPAPRRVDGDDVVPNNLTAFERETRARQAEEGRQFALSEARRKQHDARTDSDLAALRSVLSGKVRALLEEHFKDDPTAEDTVTRMMREIDPILAAGKDGRRRERGRMFIAPPKAAAA